MARLRIQHVVGMVLLLTIISVEAYSSLNREETNQPRRSLLTDDSNDGHDNDNNGQGNGNGNNGQGNSNSNNGQGNGNNGKNNNGQGNGNGNNGQGNHNGNNGQGNSNGNNGQGKECDRPGAVCQDPRFIGGDGITFYFHGRKDRDFCIVSDNNLHINAHFIGRRNQLMKRDFTWVQSIGVLFGNHKLSIGAKKTSTWNDAVDRLFLIIDGHSIHLPSLRGAKWESEFSPKTSITRTSDTNGVVLEVDGLFRITAAVVPITQEESRVHNYGITKDDCFAHLELGFKFFSLTEEVNGVLGQTYRSDYVSRVKMGVPMPVVGGAREFASTGLLEPDCSVSQFDAGKLSFAGGSSMIIQLPGLSCSSDLDAGGVICKR